MNENLSRRLVVPALLSGALMAIYLVLRPYGDVGNGPGTAAAFASPLWVLSHLAGAGGLSAAAWWAVRASALGTGRVGRVAAWAGPLGMVGVLPYYGAETFALHVLGRRGLAGEDILPLADAIRGQLAGMTLFGVGLILLAVAGVAAARSWQQAGRHPLAAWPLGLLVAGALPQYYLPVPGRIGFGLLFLAAGVLMAWAATRQIGTARPAGRAELGDPVSPSAAVPAGR